MQEVEIVKKSSEPHFRSPQYFQNRKHISLVVRPEDYQMLQSKKNKLSRKTKKKISMSEVIRLAIEEYCNNENCFVIKSPPIKQRTVFKETCPHCADNLINVS